MGAIGRRRKPSTTIEGSPDCGATAKGTQHNKRILMLADPAAPVEIPMAERGDGELSGIRLQAVRKTGADLPLVLSGACLLLAGVLRTCSAGEPQRGEPSLCEDDVRS